jgi:hypothetical protein
MQKLRDDTGFYGKVTAPKARLAELRRIAETPTPSTVGYLIFDSIPAATRTKGRRHTKAQFWIAS